MKKFFLFMLLLFSLIYVSGVSAEPPLCEQEVGPNVQCNMVTPPLNCTAGETYDLVNNSDGSTIINDGSMSRLYTYNPTNFVYNFTFQQGVGNYKTVLCDGTSRQIRVRDDLLSRLDLQDIQGNFIYIVGLLFALGLFLIGNITNDEVFHLFMGLFLMVMAIFSITQGFHGFDYDLVETTFMLVLLGTGAYFFIARGLDWINRFL